MGIHIEANLYTCIEKNRGRERDENNRGEINRKGNDMKIIEQKKYDGKGKEIETRLYSEGCS